MSQIKWNNSNSINNFLTNFEKLENPKAGAMLYHKNDKSWHFSKEKREMWEAFIKKFITDNNFTKLFKFQTIDNIFIDIYSMLLKDNNINFGDEIVKVTEELKNHSKVDYTFYFKVENIIFLKPYSSENISIGTNLPEIDSEQNITDHLSKFITELKQNNQIEIAKIWEEIKSSVTGTVIVVKEKGDNDFSREKAIEIARKFLNELLFFTDTTYFFQTMPCLEIDNPTNSKYLKQDPIINRLSYKSINNTIPTKLRICLDPTSNLNEWNESLKEKLNKYNFPIFKNSKKSGDFSDRISTAINWYSNAMKSNNINYKFLFCCIGLESLFSINQGAPITQTLSDTAALLLGRNLKERLDIKDTVTELYSQRSSIAHGRNTYIDDLEFRKISIILKDSIYSLLELTHENNWVKVDELTKYLERLKFDSSDF